MIARHTVSHLGKHTEQSMHALKGSCSGSIGEVSEDAENSGGQRLAFCCIQCDTKRYWGVMFGSRWSQIISHYCRIICHNDKSRQRTLHNTREQCQSAKVVRHHIWTYAICHFHGTKKNKYKHSLRQSSPHTVRKLTALVIDNAVSFSQSFRRKRA